MNIEKFCFIRDIVQSDEWLGQMVGMDDIAQHEHIEHLYKVFKKDYAKLDYDPMQFYEEFLQKKYEYID